MSNWLSRFVSHNRDFAGNLLKNVSPFAFAIPGIGPLAAAGLGAAGSALGRGIQHGGNLGNILKQGVQGGAMAYGGAQGMNALKAAFAPSSSAAGTVAGNVAGGAPGSFTSGVAGSGGGYMSDAAVAAGRADGQAASGFGGIGSMAGDALRGAGSFMKANPNAIAGGLQGLGTIGSMGSENAYRRAQTNAVNQNTAMSAEELATMKRRQAALLPLLQALQGQARTGAPNPYNPSATNPYGSAGASGMGAG